MKNKRLFLLIALLACMFTCVFVACNPENGGEPPVEETIVVNKFDHYDDIKMFAMDTAAFDGALRVNNNANYIKSGRASMEVYFQSIGPNNPYLPVYASNLGITNITKVQSFGLYIYNMGEPFTFGFVAKDAADGVIYSKQVEVASGANDLKLITDMEILQYIGKAIYSYELQFMSINGGTTVYLDELYAVTTTKAIEPIKEIDEIVSAIANLDAKNEDEVFATYAKYKALKNEYKVAVNSYPVLKQAVDEFFMDDLTVARLEEPKKILFFDKPFGEVQIIGTGTGVTASYSTEWAASGESGSLKVEVQESNINWLSIRTSANISVADAFIKFTVYNDSDQRKLFTLNWMGEWILPANAATTIVCKSSLLTNTAPGGYIFYCGLVGDSWACESPKGTIYISSIEGYVPNPELQALRVGEEANTLFFFDREVGEDMILNASEGVSYDFTTDKAYGNEDGSMKVSFANLADQSTVNYVTAGYLFDEGDYVYFNVYNDTQSALQLMVEYRAGIRLEQGKWTEVIIPVEDFDKYDYFRFWSLRNNLDGDVYISKAKVISGEDVELLSNKSRNEEWSFGNLQLIGAIDYDNYSLAIEAAQTLTNPLGYAPYLFNEGIRINFMEYPYGRIHFKLKNEVDMTQDIYFELTVKNDVRLEDMTLHAVDENGEWVYNWINSEGKFDLGNGYTKYLFCLGVNPKVNIKTVVVQPITEMEDIDIMQFVLTDIRMYTFEESLDAGWNENSITALRTGDDANTLIFNNLQVGVEEQYNLYGGLAYEYATSKQYETEEGALKVTLLENESGLSTLHFNLFDAKYAENKRVKFAVFLDRDTPMYLYLGWENETMLQPNQWNIISIDAAVFFNNRLFRFSQVDGHKDTTLYISKVTINDITTQDKAIDVLVSADSRASTNFGSAISISSSSGNIIVSASPSDWGTSWGVPEFAWNKAAIESLIDLGFGTISFKVQLANTAYYLGIYISSAEGNYLTSDSDISIYTHSWGYKIHYVPNGATVTLDLEAVLTAMNAKDASLIFAVSNKNDGIAVDSADSSKITLADVTFGGIKEKTPEEKALKALVENTASGNFGWAAAPSVNSGSFSVTGHPADWGTSWGVPEFAWNKAAIESLIDLGFGTISFKVQLANTAYYLGIYISSAEGNYLTSDSDISIYTHSWGYKIHYVPNGATVTLDLEAVLTAMNAKDASLIFAVSNKNDGIAVDSADSSKITLANISFEMLALKTAEERAFGILAASSTYSEIANAYGYASSVSAVNNTVVINAAVGSDNFGGFTWSKTAMQSLADLGVETFTFTINTTNGTHIDMYVSTDRTEYLFGEGFEVKGGNLNHYISNGATVTVDVNLLIQAITNNTTGDNVKFVLCATNNWQACGAGTVTLSNISFQMVSNA